MTGKQSPERLEPVITFTRTDYRPARQTVVRLLGRETVARFHRPIAAFDWAAVIGLPLVFIGNALVLATWSGWGWFALFVVQGLLIQTFGYVVHDLFIHRRVGRRTGYYVAAIFELPITFRLTWHELYHIDHHGSMNTRDDPEAYKQDLDTRVKRIFFLTLPGAILTMARRLKPRAPVSPHVPMAPLSSPRTYRERWQLQFERVLTCVWIGGLTVTCFLWWELPVFGYLLPMALVTPVASGFRTILEHAECSPQNVFHCATFYRTGLITRPLFFWDAGDCHIVHHIFPAIPFYRMPAAVKAVAPILKAHGARERRSLFELLRGWFWRNEEHRTIWSR